MAKSRASGFREETLITRTQKTRLAKTKAERDLEIKLALVFWQETVRRPCRLCGDTQGLEAHHVIAKSILKRELAAKGKPCPAGVIWDARNGMSLCRACHERFTNRALQIDRSKLSMANEEFAAEHGLGWRLDRDYVAEAA